MKQQIKFKQKKQELLTQITALISKVGYENITIRSICKELNISTGTFYHYFSEKSDLVQVLFTDIDEFFLNDVSAGFTENERDNLIAYTISYGNYTLKNGLEACRCISIAPLTNKDKNYLEENRPIFIVLQKIFERGLQKKQFLTTLSVLELTRMYLVLMRGYITDWAKRDGNYDLVSALDSFSQFFSTCIS